MKKSVLLSGLAGAVVLYVINALFYGFSGILDSHQLESASACMRGNDEVLAGPIILGHLVLGFLLAYVYQKWARGTHNFTHGIQYGALLGAAFGLGLNLIWYATSYTMTLSGHIVDSVWSIVSYGIMGGIISVVAGATDKE